MDPQERHYTVQELAAAWNLSEDSIRRLFQGEPGILDLGKPTRFRRIYRPIRIPARVAERVYRRLTGSTTATGGKSHPGGRSAN